jgi:nitroimidazol reductase NimA-like FMN-containing flavoprotein (pyridoxamine 5'-phosphate oxidase superfamily)
MTQARDPVFRELDAGEAHELLARHHVGRIAYSFHDRVDIEPISYVFADGAIYMRTSPGSKLVTLAHAPWVAFEVDEATGPFDWRSVVAHGTVYPVSDVGPQSAREAYQVAVNHLRKITPAALRDDDPAPARRFILKLHLDSVIGREARSDTSDRPPSR